MITAQETKNSARGYLQDKT